MTRWDDEYEAYRQDQAESRTLTIDPQDDKQWYQDAKYN